MLIPMHDKQVIDVVDGENGITFHALPLTGKNETEYMRLVLQDEVISPIERTEQLSAIVDLLVKGWTLHSNKIKFIVPETDKPSEYFSMKQKSKIINLIENASHLTPDDKKK